MSTETTLHNTPLLDEHLALGAKMVGFGGWNMPLQYEGILTEWEYNRKTCSIFDCSHMGEFLVKGDAVKSGLDRIVTQSIADMRLKTCRYGAMLNPQGGVIDDLIVYRKAPEEWMIVVNASNISKNAGHFRANLSSSAQFSDISFQTAKIDVQGPLSREVLSALVPDLKKLEYYGFDEFLLWDQTCLISRTGYTGELGYELYCPWTHAVLVWRSLLKDARVKPTGLGVRDVLRIEMCFSLYGHELEENISPLEAGLDKFIDWNKNFIGKDAVAAHKARGVARTIGYILSDTRRSPRQHHKIYDEGQRPIGEITSGSFSPGAQAGIGIGFLEKNQNLLEKKIVFGDDKTVCPGKIVPRPFYRSGSLKK